MLPIIKEDILSVLDQAIESLKNEEHIDLSELSNHVIHDASIFQDEDSLSVAILIYALSKVVQRCCEQKIDYSQIIPLLEKAKMALEEDDYEYYGANIKKLFQFISKIDTKMKLYVEEVIQKAKIKKGSKLHEHGLSIGRTAEILGISQWELMNYVGKTTISTVDGVDVRTRLSFARKLFE